MPAPSPDRYAVGIPGVVRERFAADQTWARSHGLRGALGAALREIDFRLSVEPGEWGESREWLEFLQVQLRCGTSRMVTVLYGVDERHRIVWVKEFRVNRNYRPRAPEGG